MSGPAEVDQAPVSWTHNVVCRVCRHTDWSVRNGQWTCSCLHVMTEAEVAEYHTSVVKEHREESRDVSARAR